MRKEKGLSFQQLSELLDKQGVTISHTNLKNYEINDKLHALYNRTKGMSLENFVALADVFDVSVDYLLGRSKSKKAEYRKMSEELCLTDEVIDMLKAIVKEDKLELSYGQRINIINALLLEPDFIEAFEILRNACFAYEMYRAKSGADVLERSIDDEKLEEAKKYIFRYGLKAVDSGVIHDLLISQALTLIGGVIRKFPAKLVEDSFM